MDKNLIFCIINANSNIFTNITIKSILKFYPTAKIFIIDAFANIGYKFQLIDSEDSKNIEVINGISPFNGHLIINLHQTELSEDQISTVKQKLLCDNEIYIYNTGDLNHTMNIQYAIDLIDQNFILLDCDAPLIQPIDFIENNFITIAQIKDYQIEDQRVFLSRSYTRFIPFIQFMNVKMIKDNGIKYYSEELLAKNLDLALLTTKDHILLFPTGSIFLKQILKMNILYKNIEYSKYVDHFNGATWKNKLLNDESKIQFENTITNFYIKYQDMFKQKII